MVFPPVAETACSISAPVLPRPLGSSLLWTKLLVLRYGGLRLYRRALPLFYGLIVGGSLASCAWPLVSAIFGMPSYNAFGWWVGSPDAPRSISPAVPSATGDLTVPSLLLYSPTVPGFQRSIPGQQERASCPQASRGARPLTAAPSGARVRVALSREGNEMSFGGKP
jgi:hypothetical protein